MEACLGKDAFQSCKRAVLLLNRKKLDDVEVKVPLTIFFERFGLIKMLVSQLTTVAEFSMQA